MHKKKLLASVIQNAFFALPLVFSSAYAAESTTPEQPQQEDETRLDTISVTASRVERTTQEVPASIAVVDSKRIEDSKMSNIKDEISGIPGVLVESKNGGYDARLIIRGAGQKATYGVREIMVLRDGVPMTDPDSFSRFDFIDTQDIERVEIVKGPGSLYGAGSAGGTIQIISKSVFDTENRARIGYGEWGAEDYHLRYGGKVNDNNALAITASRRVLDNDWRAHNNFDTNQLSLKHGLMLQDNSILESELSYSEANLELPGSMNRTQFEEFKRTGEQTDTQDAWKNSGRFSKIWFFNSRLEKNLSDTLVFRPRIYFTEWSHYHPVTGVINDNPGTNVFGTDLEFSYDHQLLGNSTLVAGVTARRDITDDSKKYKYRDIVTGFGGRITSTLSDEKGALMETEDATNTLYGFYMQETLRPTEKLLVDLGFRLDRSNFDINTVEFSTYNYSTGTYVDNTTPVVTDLDKSFNLFAPRIGVSYALTDIFNVFGTVAQSDQIPAESEIQKNRELDASTARNFEVGVKARAHSWGFDASVYNIKVSDEIVSVLLDGGETTYQNAGKTDKKGFEFSGRLRLADRWWLGAGYAYSDYTFDDFLEVIGTSVFDRSGNHLPYVPRNQYSLSMDYNHPSGFKARVQAETWGSYYMDNANSEKYEGYELITGLMLGYQRGPHALTLNVDNVFDEHYATEVKKSVQGTRTSYYYYAASPRSAMLSYRYAF